MIEEARAIELVRAGEADAFTGIVECYQPPIFRYLCRLTGNYELARDLTQDTFIQAYKNILKTDSDLSLKAWLYRIATNNARQHYRRRKILQIITLTPFQQENLPYGNDDPDENLAIRQTLLKIPEQLRSCLLLHCSEGFRYREIAAALGISEDAVRKRVARAKIEFRKLYEGGGQDEMQRSH